MGKRRFNRFKKRFDTRISSGDAKFRGISGNLSEGGIFIRSKQSFVPGSQVDIELALGENDVSRLQGVVKWSKKTALPTVPSGMGIEVTAKDRPFTDLLCSLSAESDVSGDMPQEETPTAEMEDASPLRGEDISIIVPCPSCNVKNRVLRARMSERIRCGKCGSVLDTSGYMGAV
jgi:Tfp pilus assembly protein PilZ